MCGQLLSLCNGITFLFTLCYNDSVKITHITIPGRLLNASEGIYSLPHLLDLLITAGTLSPVQAHAPNVYIHLHKQMHQRCLISVMVALQPLASSACIV